jgi:hypothetical protein
MATEVTGRTVTVTIPRSVGQDLSKIVKIQKELVGRLGHQGCYSGFDILFRLESDFTVDAKSLELKLTGR